MDDPKKNSENALEVIKIFVAFPFFLLWLIFCFFILVYGAILIAFERPSKTPLKFPLRPVDR